MTLSGISEPRATLPVPAAGTWRGLMRLANPARRNKKWLSPDRSYEPADHRSKRRPINKLWPANSLRSQGPRLRTFGTFADHPALAAEGDFHDISEDQGTLP